MPAIAKVRPGISVLVYLVTEDWYLMSHRLQMAREAQRAGFDVHVITQVNKHGAAIEALGFTLHPIAWRRGSIGPFRFLSKLEAERRLEDKDLRSLVRAHEILAQHVEPVRLLIAGDPDPTNLVSIPLDVIAAWAHQPGVELLGHVADIRNVWKAAQIAAVAPGGPAEKPAGGGRLRGVRSW